MFLKRSLSFLHFVSFHILMTRLYAIFFFFFFFQAEDGIRDLTVTGVQTCALPIFPTIFASRSFVSSATRRSWRSRSAVRCDRAWPRTRARRPRAARSGTFSARRRGKKAGDAGFGCDTSRRRHHGRHRLRLRYPSPRSPPRLSRSRDACGHLTPRKAHDRRRDGLGGRRRRGAGRPPVRHHRHRRGHRVGVVPHRGHDHRAVLREDGRGGRGLPLGKPHRASGRRDPEGRSLADHARARDPAARRPPQDDAGTRGNGRRRVAADAGLLQPSQGTRRHRQSHGGAGSGSPESPPDARRRVEGDTSQGSHRPARWLIRGHPGPPSSVTESPNGLLVGLGRWGEKHLRVLRELGATVWVADVSASRRAWAVQHGVGAARAVDDYHSVLDRVDAVDIVTPADSHLAIAETCLRAGRPCFVEKPVTVTAADGRRLAASTRAAGRVVQVGHVFRFHPVTATLREALGAGRIGPVRYATGRLAGLKRPRTDVGVTHTDAIHYFDLFAYLFDRPATSVAALQRDYLGRGLDDLSVTIVHYGEIPTVVEANYFVPGTHRDCVIVGEHGSLVADYGSATVTLHLGEFRRSGAAWEAVDTGKEDLPVHGEEPLQRELAAFLDACAGGTPSPVDASAGVQALVVVEAAARAAALGRTVTL